MLKFDLSLLCFLLSSISNINDKSISRESSPGHIDGNGVFCHWTTDPLIVRTASGLCQTVASSCALQACTQPLLIKTGWPSGLRRWLKAPFRKVLIKFGEPVGWPKESSSITAARPLCQNACTKPNPATRNRTRDHLIAAHTYGRMLYQLSYSRLEWLLGTADTYA